MPYLVFKRDNRAVIRYPISGTKTTVGRDQTSDIQLEEDDISRTHFTIEASGEGYQITDTSTNGTLVNGAKIISQPLKNGDTVTAGSWSILFSATDAGRPQETVIKDVVPAHILCYEEKRKSLTVETLELSVTHAGGKGSRHSLAAEKITIGSADTNDIVISDDQFISSTHCTIKNEDGRYILEDTDSKNGILFGNEKIKKISLTKKGRFVIGQTTVKFEIKKIHERIKPAPFTSLGPIVGRSKPIQELFSLITRVAPSDATVCITGGSGTGKELVARYIHESSGRAGRPFVALNCGAIPANLIESEFFGHERGAFTSATSQHRGVFEQADGGTLFLDEIGEMPADLQTRLLRVLETGEIKRVGGCDDIEVDVRIIAATNHNLKKLVKEGRFREDLFFRLYIVPISIPPLAERKEDIPLLTEYFLSEFSPDGKVKVLSDGACNRLMLYDWPGNVRELKNAIQRAVIVTRENTIHSDDIIFTNLSTGEGNQSLEELEKNAVVEALRRSNGNTSEAARKLMVARTTIISMLKRYNIEADDFKIR